ncbi:MAG: bi-domain-containing oxidoreductase [Candidatus Hodarchaeota archaeon]
MKQIFQNIKTGKLEIINIPIPQGSSKKLIIKNRISVVSSGTERMLLEFGKSNLLQKAKAQPEKVKQVLEKIRIDGLMPTIDTVFAKLDEPIPLGYCSAGIIMDSGSSVCKNSGLKPGDRIVSNGPHAEIVSVPKNLCAKIPDSVSDEQAAFTVLGAIGLQGIRLLNPDIGETVAITGLGLIGLLSVQILVANGCRVIGIDPDPKRSELARFFGAETVDLANGADPVDAAMRFSGGRGVDGVLITAATKSNEVVHQAAEMSRKRGRIVLVGVVGLELRRSDFYKKELTFQVSCSYGPGRYDPEYEEKGHDYPLPYVRWTAQRNFETVLDLMATGKLDVSPLITHRFPFNEAIKAYEIISESKVPYLGIILQYGNGEDVNQWPVANIKCPKERTIEITKGAATANIRLQSGNVGVIGAGNFTKLVLIPALKKSNARLKSIASAGGMSGAHAAAKFGFQQTTTDYRTILSDNDITTVFITTRHNLHARIVIDALEAGKHVFVEKPLCINEEELKAIKSTIHNTQDAFLMVGFNRRFSPLVLKMQSLLKTRTEPLTMSMMVNAGAIPPESWTHDRAIGGGRIIGEGCHWIDLMAFLAGCNVDRVCAMNVGRAPSLANYDDKISISLGFADGSIGTLNYFGNGNKKYPKETLEVFCNGKVLRLDNFRKLTGYGWKGFRRMKLLRQDKGHNAEISCFLEKCQQGGVPLIPFEQIENVTRATFAAVESADTSGQLVILD